MKPTALEQKVADFLMERGCLKMADALHCAKQLVKMIAPQLEEAQKQVAQLIGLCGEAVDLLGEFAAYGNCECDVPNGKTCEVCEASLLSIRIREVIAAATRNPATEKPTALPADNTHVASGTVEMKDKIPKCIGCLRPLTSEMTIAFWDDTTQELVCQECRDNYKVIILTTPRTPEERAKREKKL